MKPIKSLRVIIQLKPKDVGTSQNTNEAQLNHVSQMSVENQEKDMSQQ